MIITDKKEIIKELSSVLLQIKPNIEGEIQADDHLKDEWGFDSMDLVEFVARLEYQYQLIVPDEDLLQFTTLNNVVRYLEDKLPDNFKFTEQ